ncbi:MAG: MATE family efflux transporter [Oligoflexia bacterium]|nr:MATE family efflux transporter [Oligoflexia bacterium]
MLNLIRLAIPVALTYLGIMLMGVVDLIAVGRLGAAPMGAVGISHSFFTWFMVFGLGLLAGMDYPVAHAFGARKFTQAKSYLWQGIYLSLAVGVPMTGLLLLLGHYLDRFGFDAEVVRETGPYFAILAWSLLPTFLFAACRNYLQAISRPRAALVALIITNVVNAFLNYTLVLGNLGFPALGTPGSAIATLVSRYLMAAIVLGYAVLATRARPARPDGARTREIIRLGLPASGQMVLEVGVFALSTLFAGRLSADDLAAHQVVLNLASLTFMVPLGIGSATAVLVGQALGEDAPARAARTGWNGFGLGVGFMACAAVTFLLVPQLVLGIYSNSPSVIAVARQILVVAALFQISDGTQVVLTGALRGFADTRSPMLVNLFGHWVVGLPLGLWLCFKAHQGLWGLWMGLAIGLTVVAVALLAVWIRRSRQLTSDSLTARFSR